MSWREPTTIDLTAVLNTREVDVYQRAGVVGEVDPADALMAHAVGVLRGYLRRGGVPMSPRGAEIPEELMGPAMDYAAYSLCKRLAVPVSKERADAWRAATELFRAIGERKLMPEPYTDPAAAGGALRPLVSDPSETAILG